MKVFDGTEFQRNPESILVGFCADIGVPFSTEMLNWECGQIRKWDESEVLSQKPWHETLERSRKIDPPTGQKLIPVKKEHKEMVARAIKIYNFFLKNDSCPCPGVQRND